MPCDRLAISTWAPRRLGKTKFRTNKPLTKETSEDPDLIGPAYDTGTQGSRGHHRGARPPGPTGLASGGQAAPDHAWELLLPPLWAAKQPGPDLEPRRTNDAGCAPRGLLKRSASSFLFPQNDTQA